MSIQELEAEALKLSEAERAELAERLLASLRRSQSEDDEDPIWGLGRNPVSIDAVDGSINHDQYIYGDLSR